MYPSLAEWLFTLRALRALLAAYEDLHGVGVCDCMPEPQNAGHVCAACLARIALENASPMEPRK